MSRLVLTNATVLDGINPPVTDRTVVIEGERIDAVTSAKPEPTSDDRVVDLGGSHAHARHVHVPLPRDLPRARLAAEHAVRQRVPARRTWRCSRPATCGPRSSRATPVAVGAGRSQRGRARRASARSTTA